MQSICEEATYLTIAHDYENGADLINKIDAIIEKYRPAFIPKEAAGYTTSLQPVIRWCFETYNDLDDMLKNIPYGGSSVFYPPYEIDSWAVKHSSPGYLPDRSQFIAINGEEQLAKPMRYEETYGYMKGNGLPNNRVFTLTITCNYQFSSSMVKLLFGSGVNSCYVKHSGNYNGKATGAKGTMYLLWAGGAGIVNTK